MRSDKMNCIFCKIANKEIPAYIVYEDDIVVSFLDIHPGSNGHLLIVPKKHFQDLDDIDEKTFLHIFRIAKKLKNKIEKVLTPDGITIIQNNGIAQDIKHFHLHLKPIYKRKEDLANLEKIVDKLK